MLILYVTSLVRAGAQCLCRIIFLSKLIEGLQYMWARSAPSLVFSILTSNVIVILRVINQTLLPMLFVLSCSESLVVYSDYAFSSGVPTMYY